MDRSLEKIEQDMLKRAREIWEIPADQPFEAFDPVVKMLIGACAVEIQKISQEIQTTENRLLEKAAQIMLPEVLTGPIPASTILHIQPIEPVETISPELQASCSKGDQQVVFSPTGNYQILNGEVKLMLLRLTDNLLNITNHTQPQLINLHNKQDLEVSNSRTLFLGLDLHNRINKLDRITFFFDWVNLSYSQREEYCKLLQSTRWYINEQQIQTMPGIPQIESHEETIPDSKLDKAFGVSTTLENRVNSYYKHHFITLLFSENETIFSATQENCPESIKHLIDKTDPIFATPLTWIKIHFPASFSNTALRDDLTHCLINCVPAMNRKLETRKHSSWDSNMNVIPLKTDAQFLAIKALLDNQGKFYQNVQGICDHSNKKDQYYLRRGGVGRIDSRNAKELIVQLQHLLKDEGAAFTALYPNDLITDLRSLRKIAAKIEKHLHQSEIHLESIWYVILASRQKEENSWEEFTVQFWSTLGAMGNNIPPGQIKSVDYVDSGPGIKNITNISTTISGRNRLETSELVAHYRYELMTRERIVTAEDIKTFCLAYLESQITAVNIHRGIMVDKSPKTGIVRTIEISLIPSLDCRFTEDEWQQVCYELKKAIERQWVGNWPLVVGLIKTKSKESSI